VVKATTDSAHSGLQAGKSVKAKAARKRTQAGFFAAILKKALNGPAAPEKTGKAKNAVLPLSLKFRRTDTAEESGRETPARRISGKRKFPESLRKPEKSGGKLAELRKEEKRSEEPALAVSPAALFVSTEKAEQNLPADAENAGQGVPFRTDAAGSAVMKDAVLSAALPQAGMFPAAAPDTPSAGGSKAAGEKSRTPDGEKKFSVRQESSKEAGPKKTEKPDAAIPVQETKPLYADEAKKDETALKIEIQIISRAGDEGFGDGTRMPGERSLKELASGLLRRMREEGNEQIVKNARFILKDKNEGEIRLILKPESLGEVRIRLSLHDNLIGGRIFVENDSVKESFEQNMPDLASAFKEGGLELGSLNVSVGNDKYRESADSRQWSFPEWNGRTEKETPPVSLAPEYYFSSHSVNFMV
jgi:flagellar hook-length control protein FliK